MSSRDVQANSISLHQPIGPHEVNVRVSHWNMEISGIQEEASFKELETRLIGEPEIVQSRVRPLLVSRRAELTQAKSGHLVNHHVAPEPSDQLAWVPEAVRAVIQAVERVESGEAGVSGLVPLGFLRDGGMVLLGHRVIIRDQFKGNRAAIFAQSGKGKTNLVKVVLFWVIFNPSYGKLVFDYKGEYVPWTQNERGEEVPGLCEHPLAKERLVLYTTSGALHDKRTALSG
jgi:hypothetical protein